MRSGLLREKSELCTLTRAVTGVVNTGTAAVLTLVRTITAYPPSSIAGHAAVWGPHTEPLSPNSWRRTVGAGGSFDFKQIKDTIATTPAEAGKMWGAETACVFPTAVYSRL